LGKFLEDGYVGIGWLKLGDISNIRDDVEALWDRLDHVTDAADESDSDWTTKRRNQWIGQSAGLVHRFASEMKAGDLVIFPTTHVDRCFHIGIVTGPYRHAPGFDDEYTHLRPVKWLRKLNRDDLTAESKRKLTFRKSFCRVHDLNNELRKVLKEAASGVLGA